MNTASNPLSSQRAARASKVRMISRLIPVLKTIKPVANLLAASWEKQMRENARGEIEKGEKPPGVLRDRLEIGVSILRTVEKAILDD